MDSTSPPDQVTPLPEELTLIITTSPTPSAPTTDLLSAVFRSFRTHCSCLLPCKLIIVFDSYDSIVPKARLKKGHVTEYAATCYTQYKTNVKELIFKEYELDQGADLVQGEGIAEYGYEGSRSPNQSTFTTNQTQDGRVTFVEPIERLGFGLAVRTALRLTTTTYVWIHQHDWTLVYDIPIRAMLEVMKASTGDAEKPINYICLPSIRMLSYAVSPHVLEFPELRAITSRLKGVFTSKLYPDLTIPLTPLFFWHDKPHIASTSHYLNRVFPTRLAIPRGRFIEDTVGHRARTQMKEGNWTKWACWLYSPGDGKQLCLRHLEGRKWRGVEGEMRLKKMHMETNSTNNL
jgi:hypothetical protein